MLIRSLGLVVRDGNVKKAWYFETKYILEKYFIGDYGVNLS